MLSAAELLRGYARGVFPMAESAADPRLFWFDPPMRGVLPVGGVHAPRSLRRELRRGGWTAHIDGDFDQIVRACADRPLTWISDRLRKLYHDLYLDGHAHALEIRHDGEFAGGIFGVSLGQAFFGESMVSLRRDGSKMALIWVSDQLARAGFTLFDTQFLTPHLQRMGGVEIPRQRYRQKLQLALRGEADFRAVTPRPADQLLQEITQIS